MTRRRYRYAYRNAVTGRWCSAAYAMRYPARTVRHRFLLTVLLALLALAACTPTKDRVLVRPQVVEVPRYIRAEIPAQLIEPLSNTRPDGSCWRDGARVLCNGQLAAALLECRATVDRANADRAALRNIQAPAPVGTP
jgi:hypothetical protein